MTQCGVTIVDIALRNQRLVGRPLRAGRRQLDPAHA